MHSMQSLILIALMAVCALAAPTPRRSGLSRKTFSFPVKPRFSAHRKPHDEMFHTFGKYGWQIIVWNPTENPWSSTFGGDSSSTAAPAPAATSSIAPSSANETSDASSSGPSATTPTAAAKTSSASSGDGETGDVAATPEENESEYLSKVTIGGQSLNLDFDTGSADL